MEKKIITPIKDRLVVETIKSSEMVGSIIVPESARGQEKMGKVIAVGPNVEEVKIDDVVLFGEYSGTPFSMGEIMYRIMTENEVFAVL